jgi:Zn finger protein HypA/HybF involved in hydrogenase expression
MFCTLMQRRSVDMSGQRVGLLLVERQASSVDGHARWMCLCECGARTIVDGVELRRQQKLERSGKRRHLYSCPECRSRGLRVLAGAQGDR